MPHKANVKHNREPDHYRLFSDYFHPRTSKLGPYFRCKPSATGKLGFTSYQKFSTAIHMLAYEVSSDLIDECLRMCETTYLDLMYKFCKGVIAVLGEFQLRQPNVSDTA
jgi:hypothetical protein